MGYPMTYQRVVNRNRLVGDYGAVFTNVNLTEGYGSASSWKAELIRVNYMWGPLVGDLRRLELDSQDENATAKHIAKRTGVDVEVVAAVLKEFLAW